MFDPKNSLLLSEIHFWTPVVGLGVTIWKVYSWARNNVNKWADTLLNNHLAHVQESLDILCEANSEQVDLLKKILNK